MKKEKDILNPCGHRNSERVEALMKFPSAVCPACLNEQIAEFEAQLEQHRWIPVSERLPEVPLGPPNASTESVWLIFKDKPQIGYYTNYDGWNIYGIRFQKRINQKDITHWKPIILP